MAIKVSQWLKGIWHGRKVNKNRPLKTVHYQFEHLESRELLSGSNAIDRLDFGNLSSETSHNFEPGYTADQMPAMGAGTVGASAGLTYRNPTGSQSIIFTLAVDPNRQNYLTIRLWGNDVPSANMNLQGVTSYDNIEDSGGTVQYPNRFLYHTLPIPISMTTGQTSVQLTLTAGRPIYSVYSHTDPFFVPDSADPTGVKPSVTGQATLDTLSETEANNILLANRQSIYNSGGYFDQMLARQTIVINGSTWTAPTGAPKEVAGLDLFTNVSSWMSSNPSATNDQWRNKIANTKAGPGYTAVPDELLGVLTTTYLLDDLKNSSGTVLYSTGHYHDSSLVTRITAAIDGVTYQQDSDGGIMQQGSEWTGLCSTARTTGSYIGTTARQATLWGGGALQGVDTYAVGWSIIQLLNDSTAAPILQSFLGQSYDADLNSGSMVRAYAWERLLKDMIAWDRACTGGTSSQNFFEELSMYAATIALNKLQALYPNSSYTTDYATSLGYVKELMGLTVSTHMQGVSTGNSNLPNYGLSEDGFGEAHGVLSCGFDGGGYGQILPWLATRVAQLTEWDNNIDTASRNSIIDMANRTINGFDHFLYSQENATVNSSGVVTSDTFTFSQETWITYRDVKNINSASGGFNTNAQFLASDPNGALNNGYALRAAYLNTQYNLTPGWGASGGSGWAGGSINYLRDLAAYESTIESLIGVNPTTLTELPGEPGQPDYALADAQAGAVAFINHGDRLFMNANWHNYETYNGFVSPSYIARINYATDTIQRASIIIMPYNSATVQPDGNYTSTSLLGAKVVRFGDYLIVLNQSTSSYSAKLPTGVGLAEDIINHNTYSLGSTVLVPAGQSAIFWLDASSVIGPIGAGADIGSVGTAGSDSYTDGVYTVRGAGADIGGTTDAFRFASNSVSGDVTVAAQILSQTNTNASAKAGVMIRDGSAANAAFASVVRTPSNGILFQWRSSTNGSTAWAAVPTPLTPAWVKLTRSGNNISAYYSTDGVSWTQIGSTQSVSLSTSTLVGLAVTSHNTSQLSTATYSNISINTGLAPTVATAASATLATNGRTATLSVLGADNGGETGLTYTWYVTGTPSDPVAFSGATNGTNAAKNITATFVVDGVYNFRVIIKDSGGAIATNDVSVTVSQILTSVSISPTTASLFNNDAYQFTAISKDQFGMPMAEQPLFTWSIASGVGTVDSNGLYTAPASGSGSATVRATSGSLYGSASVTVSATTAVGIFSNTQAIGSYSPAGSASYTSGNYTVSSAGSDIWGTSDQFRFVYMPLTGDGTISARVASETNTDSWAKAGVMFRNTLDANSAYAMIFLAPSSSNGASFQYRTSAGGSAATNGSYAGVSAPYWVRLTRSGNSFKAERSPDGTTWTQVGTNQTISMNQTIYVGLEVCSHSSGTLMTATFDNVSVTQPTKTFSYQKDIGSPPVAGSYSETSGVVTMTSASHDIWNNSDSFYFAYLPLTGTNITLTARVASFPSAATTPNAKAGVMIRNSLDAGSTQVTTLMTPNNNARQARRTSTNGSTSESITSGLSMPYWVRIVRSGNSFTSYYSSDGISWTAVGSTQNITMGATVFVGLALTSVNDSTVATVTFDNISISGGTVNVGPTVATAAAASTNPVTGATVNLNALGSDSDAAESNLTYTWSPVGPIAGNVTFSANGTNAAKNTTVTFTKAGAYTFQVRIKDTGGLSVTSNVSVTVNQTLTSIAVSPTAPSVSPLGTIPFTAVAKDQFGNAMATQPSFTWSIVSGSGSINSTTGLYTAPSTGTSATIRATYGAINGSTAVSIVNQAPLLAASSYPSASPNPVNGTTTNLSVLGVDDAGESNLIYTWSVLGTPPAPVTFGANGNNAAKNTVATFTKAGTYNFQVAITDSGGLNVTSSVSVIVYSSIASRNIFYNNSRYDGHTGYISGDSAINIYDDNAIATDKTALLPGQMATFANYTSFSRGINGIMVDIFYLANPAGISAADFQFNVGNGSAWTTAVAPISVGVSQGTGLNGSDRVTVTWDDNVIQNQWLQVTVKADANTGLAAPDVFYFGNAIGESGDNPANAVVDFQDELGSRTHKSGIPIAPITSPYDYNRDGRVNATDDIISRHNRTDGTGGNPLQLISAPVGSPPAAGDALQPLTAADTATSQPLPSPADVVTMQPVLSLAAAIVPAQAASAPTQSPLANQVAYVSGGVANLNDAPAGKSTSAVDNVVRDPSFAMLPDVLQRLGVLPRRETALLSVTIRPTITEDFSTLSPWRNDAAYSNPTSRQDSLHDAFFTHSIVQHLLTEDGLPDDSSAPADIETLINDCLPGKNNKSLAHAIDTVLSAARRKKE